MSIRSQHFKHYCQESNSVFFSPKLSLQGKNMLPQIIEPSYTFHRQQPFLTVFKKPINNLYDNCIIRKERRTVCLVATGKQVSDKEKRDSNTGTLRKRVAKQYNFNLVANMGMTEYEISISKMSTIEKYGLSVPKSISQKNTSYNPSKQKDTKFYFYIGMGNNSSLVEKVLSGRANWTQTTSTLFHFRWEQARPKYHSGTSTQRQMINHLPNHEAISDKGSLLKNMRAYCEKVDEPLFQILPVCFEFDFQNTDACQSQLKRFVQYFWDDQERIRRSNENSMQDCITEGFIAFKDQPNEKEYVSSPSPKKQSFSNTSPSPKKRQSNSNNDGIRAYDTTMYDQHKTVKKDSNNSTTSSMKSNAKNYRRKQTNYISNETTRKKDEMKILYKALIQKLRPHYIFQDMSSLKKQLPCLVPTTSQVYGQTSLWLLKPTDMNRGRGIRLFHQLEELGDILHTELGRNQKGSFIVQKYLEKPMLISERKFDIRIWAMVTHNKEVFFFREGYARTACEKYSLESSSEFAHLTNNAIQKNSKKYGAFEDGNIIPLRQLFRKSKQIIEKPRPTDSEAEFQGTVFPTINLNQEDADELLDEEEFMTQMKKYIQVSLSSVMDKVFSHPEKLPNSNTLSNYSMTSSHVVCNSQSSQNPNLTKSKYFQIFGYDFMVDINRHLWLIEVNTNPCLEESSKFLKAIIPRMMDDAFKLTVDRLFPRGRATQQEKKVYPVEGAQDFQNLWEKLDMFNMYKSTASVD